MQDILLCGLQIYSRVSFGKAQKGEQSAFEVHTSASS